MSAVAAFTFGCAAAAAPSEPPRPLSELMHDLYPKDSLSRGEQGEVEFSVDLDADARIESCAVTRSSGYRLLDAATCDLIVLHVKFPTARTEDGKFVSTSRTGKIVWKLPQKYSRNAARAPQPLQLAGKELEEMRLFCKRTTALGSKLKTKTHCLTRSEWGLADQLSREEVLEFINPYTPPIG